MKIAILGIKLKVLMRTLGKHDFTDIMKWVTFDHYPQRAHQVSVLKDSHVWYQTEGLEKIWQIL